MSKEIEVQLRINKALTYVDTTKSVVIGKGVISSVSKCLKENFGSKPAFIIADANTYSAAGKQVLQQLQSSGYSTLEPFIFDEKEFYADMEYVDRLHTHLSGLDVVPIAVGSGTINDITKLASGRNNLPYLSVATAGSMDGYTSFGASISYKGAKQTFDCKAPLSIVADSDVIASAPREMNASGYADLIAKIPSGADWIISDALGIEDINKVAWELTQIHLRDMVSNPSGIQTGDKDAIISLMEGLFMTGLGMQVSKNSRPASGAEHQFSHLWDNQNHTFQGKHPSHGVKVGIGSLSSESLYERFLLNEAVDFNFDKNNIKQWWPDFSQIEANIRLHFHDEDLAVQTIVQSKAKYIQADQLFTRLQLLKTIWPELKKKLKVQLLGANKMKQMLLDAGAPTMPEEIGISRERLKLSYLQAQLIRQRFTILDLVLQTNQWGACVNPLFEKNGFWSTQVGE